MVTLVLELAAAMAPRLGAAVARERAAQIAQALALDALLTPLDVAEVVSRARVLARMWGERIPTSEDVVHASLAACEVLHRHASECQGPMWLGVDEPDEAA